MKKMEKYGKILGVIYENPLIYYGSIILSIGLIIFLRVMSYHFYELQLNVIINSYYQVYVILLDIFSIISIIGLIPFIILKHKYDKHESTYNKEYFLD